MPQSRPHTPLRVGVLALQGSFREHIAIINRIEHVIASEVRTEEQLNAVDGLIIPGGESTTMALVAERWGLLPALRQFAKNKKPMWGTCAGLIFLAERATGTKEGGQELIGGLECEVHRNFFGAQINSFETKLPVPPGFPEDEACKDDVFRAVFIRAPVITSVGDGVEVLARYHLSEEDKTQVPDVESVIVGVRSGNLLATSFHPELTSDRRWHMYFVEMVRESAGARMDSAEKKSQGCVSTTGGKTSYRPADMPVY